jgi:hypothetical protein
MRASVWLGFLVVACGSEAAPRAVPPRTSPPPAIASAAAPPSAEAPVSPSATQPSEPELSEAEIHALAAEWTAFSFGSLSYEDYIDADAEDRWYYRHCKSFFLSVRRAMNEVVGTTVDRVPIYVRGAREYTGELPAADVKRCATQMIRRERAHLYQRYMNEGRSFLDMIARGMQRQFADTNALCPSAPPAPKTWDVTEKRYAVARGEFSAPGFTCLSFAVPFAYSRFQYEVKVDATAGTFIAIARGDLRANGTTQEYAIAGRVENGAVVYDAMTGPSAKDLARDEPVDLGPPID